MKQDDNINEDDACKNYKVSIKNLIYFITYFLIKFLIIKFKVYKTEFKKKSMQEFFISHKDEEW